MIDASPTRLPQACRTGAVLDFSLRIWSDSEPVERVADAIGGGIAHLHLKGQPRIGSKGRVLSPAPRHYASLDGVDRLESSGFTYTPVFDVLVWVAVFGAQTETVYVPPERIIARVADLGARILVESYLDIRRSEKDEAAFPEMPLKRWYPG